jgi:hypothetical protein
MALQAPVIDRALLERLFGVRRRRAIQLMAFFGGFQTGRAFLIDRLDLIRQLEPIEASADFAVEAQRKQRLTEALEKLRRLRVAATVIIPVQRKPCEHLSDLPEGVELQPGRLRVEFCKAEELLAKLFALSQSAASDFDAFRGAAEGK